MKIVIADDHLLIVQAVADKLSEVASGATFVHALSVPELLASLGPDVDVALIDLNMPGANGLSHVAEVRRRYPDLRIIVLSGEEDREVMRAAFDAGAMGFIPKAYSPDVMLSAVRLVLAGGLYVPPMMVSGMGAPQVQKPQTAAPHAPSVVVDEPVTDVAESGSIKELRSVLTERQLDVLTLLSQGKPNKLIGRSLGISEGTVKIHLAAIFRALKVRNRTEAVVAARSVTGA